MKNFFLWLRHLGWMYLAALAVLTVIGYGAYALAIASPLVKFSFTLGGFIVYNLAEEIAKRLPHRVKDENKKMGVVLGYLYLLILPIAAYSLILSSFIVPWIVTSCITLSLILAIILVFMAEKETKIPSILIWTKNLSTFATIIFFTYQIAVLIL